MIRVNRNPLESKEIYPGIVYVSQHSPRPLLLRCNLNHSNTRNPLNIFGSLPFEAFQAAMPPQGRRAGVEDDFDRLGQTLKHPPERTERSQDQRSPSDACVWPYQDYCRLQRQIDASKCLGVLS